MQVKVQLYVPTLEKMSEKININCQQIDQNIQGQNECQMNVMKWQDIKGYYSEG